MAEVLTYAAIGLAVWLAISVALLIIFYRAMVQYDAMLRK